MSKSGKTLVTCMSSVILLIVTAGIAVVYYIFGTKVTLIALTVVVAMMGISSVISMLAIWVKIQNAAGKR
jgi:hypothetical protein